MLTVIKPVNTVKLAIAGVGNCASSLVQGIAHYRKGRVEVLPGLMHPYIGGWGPGDLEVVAAFDVDRRKVGRPLEEAIFAKPNCAMVFEDELPSSGVVVQMGPVLDGVAPHMADYPDDEAFRPADADPVDIADVFKRTGAEVLVCYLPVGSEQAALHYAQACLDTGVAMVNCIPVFIASNPSWAEKFKIAGVPIVGDDIKSQVGATIAHRLLTRLFGDRGYTLDRTYQLNTGGNTDFLNMKALDRLTSKKVSKTESVQSQLDVRLGGRDIHIGPSDYVPWQGDNKVAFIRMEGRGFGSAPIEIEMRLSVQDSPNSAGVVIDAVRCARLGMVRGMAGPLEAPSSYYMKSPPVQMRDSVARDLCDAFIEEGRAEAPAARIVKSAAEQTRVSTTVGEPGDMTGEEASAGMSGHFARVAEVYGTVRTTDRDPVHYIRDALADRANVRAADIGCGDGRYDRLLFDHIPNLHLVCVDSSAPMLERLFDCLAEARIDNFVTRLSGVNDLALEDDSLDAILTFNAVHHFNVPAFLAKARRALRDDGRLFIYTRTPEQNAGTLWGRFFPRFTEKESRLHTIKSMEAWIAGTPGLEMVEARVFRYARTASLDRLFEQMRSRHYSTFSLYDEREFEEACRGFDERIRDAFDDIEAIRWYDENIMLHLVRIEV